MQVTVSDLSPVEKKVAVEIPWPYVAQKLDEAYKDLSRGVALKGFRKGKVPRPMLERMFGRQVEQEVVKQLVQESFVAAATEHQIQPVAEPVVDDAQLLKGQPFHYSARVEVRSIIEPKDYDGIEVSQRPPHVSDEEIDRALERKRQELTEFKVIEGRHEAAATDVLVVNAAGTIGERKIEKEGMMVDLGGAEREPIPGLAQALLGIPLNADGHTVTFALPTREEKPETAAELSGAQASLKITVKEAREKQTPALDDEFAKDTGEAETLAELRDKLRGKLLAEDEKTAREEVKRDLVKELLKRNSFVVAPALVERQLDVELQRARLQMAMRGIDYRTAGIDEQRMRDDLRESANDEVRAAFLIDAIAGKEKIEVSEADLEKRLAEMAQMRDKSVPRLKAELQKEGRLESVKHQVREEKTLDLLLSRAKISEKAQQATSSSENKDK
jgi:trigger factor